MKAADSASSRLRSCLSSIDDDVKNKGTMYMPLDAVTYSGQHNKATIDDICRRNKLQTGIWDDLQSVLYGTGASKWVKLRMDLNDTKMATLTLLSNTAHSFIDNHRRWNGIFHEDLSNAVGILWQHHGFINFKGPRVEVEDSNAVEKALRAHYHTVATFVSDANKVDFGQDIRDIDLLLSSNVFAKMDTITRQMAAARDAATQGKARSTEAYQTRLHDIWYDGRWHPSLMGKDLTMPEVKDLWNNYQAKDLRAWWESNNGTMKPFNRDDSNARMLVQTGIYDRMDELNTSWSADRKALQDMTEIDRLYSRVLSTEQVLRKIRAALQQLDDLIGSDMRTSASSLLEILGDMYDNMLVGETEGLRQDGDRYWDVINNHMPWFSNKEADVPVGLRPDTIGLMSLLNSSNVRSQSFDNDSLCAIHHIDTDENYWLRLRADDQGGRKFETWDNSITYTARMRYCATSYPKTKLQYGWVIGDANQNRGATNYTSRSERIVKFDPPFAEPPVVVVWLSRIDIGEHPDAELFCEANNVTKDGFSLSLGTDHGYVQINQLGAAWLAYDKSLDGKELFSTNRPFEKRFQWSSGDNELDLVGQSFEFPIEMSKYGPPLAMAMFRRVGRSVKALRASADVRNLTKQGGSITCRAWEDSSMVAEVTALLIAKPGL